MSEIRDITDREPNPRLVAEVERLLQLAQAGKIRSMVQAISWADDFTSHGWVLDPRTGRRPMLAELMIAQSEYMLNISAKEDGGILRGLI